MDLKNKKGFITIYVMLAMMFFVVFIVSASIIASRKLKLQTEVNAALYDIYSKDIEHIIQDSDTIPIYTKEQFLQIATWISNEKSSRPTEYIYINDLIYTLNGERYSDGDPNNDYDYTFQLKTDLWFEEDTSNRSDKNEYPYIMDIDIHNLLKREGTSSPILDVGQYDDINYHIFIETTTDGIKTYGMQIIEIETAEEFLKIGTGEWNADHSIQYGSKGYRYRLMNNITIKQEDIGVGTEGFNLVNRPNFEAILDGNGKIVEWQVPMVVNNSTSIENSGFFSSNSGEIKDLTFSFADVEGNVEINTNITNFGIFAGVNNGKIENCNIMISNNATNEEMIINGNEKTVTNFGVITGANNQNGYINDDTNDATSIQGIKIQNIKTENAGIVTGENKGEIKNIEIIKAYIGVSTGMIIGNADNFTIGGICGKNTNKISDVNIKELYVYTYSNEKKHAAAGGAIGTNNGNISNVNVNNIQINTDSIYYVGGIVANDVSGTIENIVADNIKIETTDTVPNGKEKTTHVGGIVAKTTGNDSITKIKIINSQIDIGNAATNVGMICGYTDGNGVTKALANGTINYGESEYIGGIIGSANASGKTIEYCYSNVKMEVGEAQEEKGQYIGGIVGKNIFNINNCAYVNEISDSDDYVGGICGVLSNAANITSCYMNGKLPVTNTSGAIVGKISATTGTITTDVLYNKAYRWLGYASNIGTNVTYSNIAKTTDDLNPLTEGLKEEIEARIDGDLEYKYAKIEILGLRNNTTTIQMSEWSFFNGNSRRSYNGATASANISGYPDEGSEELVDNIIGQDSVNANKYCSTFGNPTIITITFGNVIDLETYSEYGYYTGNDSPERDPVSWKLSFSKDGEEYILFDYREKQNINQDRNDEATDNNLAGKWGL